MMAKKKVWIFWEGQGWYGVNKSRVGLDEGYIHEDISTGIPTKATEDNESVAYYHAGWFNFGKPTWYNSEDDFFAAHETSGDKPHSFDGTSILSTR